ncbi:MAG: hypothetical protein IJ681_06725 [Bacteroidales bacterium]|nr:hypothetical protein [Bacteroidales bacterium]
MTKKRTKKLTKRAIIISTVLLVLFILARIIYTYGSDYYRQYYACPQLAVDSVKYPVMGIDISAHQGKIDWKVVSDSKVSFAFLKATEGADFVDKSFSDNWKKAKKENMVVGAYHFFRFSKDGRIQAKNFISNVKLDENDLPPVVDFEASYGNRLGKYQTKQVQNNLLKCLREMEKHYGLKPIIYTNVETYNKYIKGNFDEYPLWICKLCNEPSKTVSWTFWQYSHKGSVAGIKGNVDVNLYNGTYNEFVNFIYKSHGKSVKKNAKQQNRPTNRRNPQRIKAKA